MEQREPPERELEQQIEQIKKQHHLQHQILLQHFQQQRQHLVEQHEQQLRQTLKEFWDKQKHLQEQRQREQLEALRRKEKHEESAVASTEVKQKLQSFLRQRASGGKGTRPENSCWSEGMDTGSDSSTTNNDFPLRKTASEPNLLKVRLKQRVMERRCSPMGGKRPPPSLKKKLLNAACLPPGDSPPPPQPTTHHPQHQPPAKEASPPCEDIHPRLALFSSPSMPNISLAAAHAHHQAVVLAPPPDLSEAAVRAACTARLGQKAWILGLTRQQRTTTFHFAKQNMKDQIMIQITQLLQAEGLQRFPIQTSTSSSLSDFGLSMPSTASLSLTNVSISKKRKTNINIMKFVIQTSTNKKKK